MKFINGILILLFFNCYGVTVFAQLTNKENPNCRPN
jgi:hypothetical protein